MFKETTIAITSKEISVKTAARHSQTKIISTMEIQSVVLLSVLLEKNCLSWIFILVCTVRLISS